MDILIGRSSGVTMDIHGDGLGGHLVCPWTYRGSFGVSMDIQGGHLGCPWIYGEGHLRCPLTYRVVIWGVHGHTGVCQGVNGQGPKAPAMARRAHSLPLELGISMRSTLYFY